MEQAIFELPSAMALSEDGRMALERFCAALRKHGDLAMFTGLFEWWATLRSDVGDPKKAVSALYTRLALRAQADAARALAGQALDLFPANADALSLFEQHARGQDADALRARYEAFLAHAPFHASSPRVRQRLIDLLVEQGDYEGALSHVSSLPPRPSISVPVEEITRACSIPPLPPRDQVILPPPPSDPFELELVEATVVLEEADIEVLMDEQAA